MRASSPRELIASERGHARIRWGAQATSGGVSGLGGGCARSPLVACFRRRSGEDVVVAGGSVARLSRGRLEDADRFLAGSSCRPMQVGRVERHGPRAVGTTVVVRRAHEHGQRRRHPRRDIVSLPVGVLIASFHGAVPKFRCGYALPGCATPSRSWCLTRGRSSGEDLANRTEGNRLWIVRRYDSKAADLIRDRAWGVDAAASGSCLCCRHPRPRAAVRF